DRIDLRVPPDQRRRHGGHVAAPRLDRADGREVAREAADVDLPDPLGRGQVLESVIGEIAKGELLRKLRRDQRPGRIRDQHLPAVAGGGNPGRAVDVDADIVLATEPGLARVEAHPYSYAHVIGPWVARQPALDAGCGTTRVKGD